MLPKSIIYELAGNYLLKFKENGVEVRQFSPFFTKLVKFKDA